jgi:hypothetical protein
MVCDDITFTLSNATWSQKFNANFAELVSNQYPSGRSFWISQLIRFSSRWVVPETTKSLRKEGRERLSM